MRNTKFSVIKHATRNPLSGFRMHRQDFQVPRLAIDKKAIFQLVESRHHFHLRSQAKLVEPYIPELPKGAAEHRSGFQHETHSGDLSDDLASDTVLRKIKLWTNQTDSIYQVPASPLDLLLRMGSPSIRTIGQSREGYDSIYILPLSNSDPKG